MRTLAFKILDAMPSKIGTVVGFAAMGYATIKPNEASALLDRAMSAEGVQAGGLIGLVVIALYWVLWFWLRPRGAQATTGAEQSATGSSSQAIGVINGNPTFYNGLVPEGTVTTDLAAASEEDRPNMKQPTIGLYIGPNARGAKVKDVLVAGSDVGVHDEGDQTSLEKLTILGKDIPMSSGLVGRFNALLGAMSQGEAPSAQKKSAARPASSKGDDGDCDETQTHPDTSKGASD